MQTRTAKYVISVGKLLDSIESSIDHYFLEAGANDGILQSNSLTLEDIGWDGILVEPSPEAFEKLKVIRKCSHKYQCALNDGSDKKVKGSFVRGDLMGTCDKDQIEKTLGKNKLKIVAKEFILKINKRFLNKRSNNFLMTVKAKTLDEIIRDSGIKTIDIMTLDVEGYEYSALNGLKEETKPRIMIIETRRRDALILNDLMLSKGYILLASSSSFTLESNPLWNGDYQDYLWAIKNDSTAIEACLKANECLES